MGLLLSVLVVCVGVLEVIACVRHFQDGYLPLWTPHCAITSGYAKTHERWRDKPSDSYEFRSTNDVSGALNHAQDQSSETFLQPSPSVENGYTVKHEFEDTKKEATPSKELHQLSGATLSSFKDENKIDISSSNLGTEESDLDLISTYDKESNIPTEQYGERKEISTSYANPNLISELLHKHTENIDNTTDRNIQLSYHSEETKFDTSSSEAAKYPKINDGIEEVCLSNKDGVNETSNILSEKQAIDADACNIYRISGQETIPFDRHVESIEESRDQRQDNKAYIFQEDLISRLTSIEKPSEDTQVYNSALTSSAATESVDVNRDPDENLEIKTGITSQLSEGLKGDDYINESIEESPYVPLSDTEDKSEIPSNIFHEQNLEDAGVSNAVTKEHESETETLETEIEDKHNISLQNETSIVHDNERPESTDIDEDIRRSRESTPKVQLEYVPLSNDQIKSEIPTDDLIERLQNVNVTNTKSESPIEESKSTSRVTMIVDTSISERENQPHKELEEISKDSAIESVFDNEENEYIQEDGEITPQPILEDGNKEISKIETTLILQEDGSGNQTEISEFPSDLEPAPVSLVIEREDKKNDGKEDTSESRLENQTTSTEFVMSKNEKTDQEPQVLVSEPEIPKEIQKHYSASPLTIDTSEESSPITMHSSHQSSMSPPQLPSTPTKKSKADISWPTFFPGAPVIKRPSVSFATPEAVFTNEDQELLRQYAEEATNITPCLKKSEETYSAPQTEVKVPSSATEDKSLETLEASERSDSFEEDVGPITFKERSPSNIVAGNDFSRKELQLQRKKSFKQKRYSSATELHTREEETEDRSFSENKPNIVRASSLKESRRRPRKPAKASSFEDALLLETSKKKEEDTRVKKLSDACTIPVIEEKEIESQRDRVVSFEGVAKVESEKGDDHQKQSNQRNESNTSKLQYEGGKEDSRSEPESTKEEDQEEESSSYSLSEEQSSSQLKSPAKEAFWLIFSGEYTKAMSKDWHSGHFCCWQCDESLTGQRYVLRDDHPYCIKCYESVFANVCEECNKTIGIDSKDLSYKDKHWHEACFLCNKCRVSLVDKQFGSKADKIYCGNCYDAQFASRCDGCGEIFRAGTKKMEYKTRQWHEKCFCCCVCKTAIGTKSFIPREQEIYCATCYEEKFATRCVKCNKIITSGGVTYKNEPWHRECFTCTNCNTSLAGQRFTSRDEKPYCADCFGELFAKRCTACSKPITGIGGTRFISFEDRHWHNDCFICATCKTSLVGRGFITDADDIICPECAKQKLM